jgi:hypothetical protein
MLLNHLTGVIGLSFNPFKLFKPFKRFERSGAVERSGAIERIEHFCRNSFLSTIASSLQSQERQHVACKTLDLP